MTDATVSDHPPGATAVPHTLLASVNVVFAAGSAQSGSVGTAVVFATIAGCCALAGCWQRLARQPRQDR